jgi:hypothetical protein
MRTSVRYKSERQSNNQSQKKAKKFDVVANPLEKTHALVAQLDRASDFESEGREFESLRARQQIGPDIKG